MRARSKEIYRRMKVLLLLSENSISPEYTLWGDNRQGSFWLTIPVFEPEARQLLSKVEPIARHYEVKTTPE